MNINSHLNVIPFLDMFILYFQGRGLNAIPGVDNLNVTVGTAYCQITEIADEYIVCVPPDDEPTQASIGDLHIVYVSIT